MFVVFSKCKDNLENGRRLENMSWRLWYRESSLKETKTTHLLSSTCPIPIQHTNNASVIEHNKSTIDKHLSPASFKRIISSVNENEVILPPPSLKNSKTTDTPNLIMLQQPQFFIEKQDIESEDDEEGWSSDDEEEPTPKNNTTVVLPIKNNKKFTISDDEDSDIEEEDEDNYRDIKDNNDLDETAFLSEFRKRTPPPIAHVITKGCSILSNMLRAQDSTRLANQPINVVQNQIQKHYIEGEELSTSMKKCVEWEHYQHDFIKLSQQHARMDSHNTFDSNYRSCW